MNEPNIKGNNMTTRDIQGLPRLSLEQLSGELKSINREDMSFQQFETLTIRDVTIKLTQLGYYTQDITALLSQMCSEIEYYYVWTELDHGEVADKLVSDFL
jgi:hypothetical protein